jgi:peptidoglycan/LPS O-acetylase OafA/YrhL
VQLSSWVEGDGPSSLRAHMSIARPLRLPALESLRGLAALYVFAHHIAHELVALRYPRAARPFIFGQAAVMIFFVISGFVIHYSTFAGGRVSHFRDYAVRRFRRIYPIFVLTLVLSYILGALQLGAWPEVSWANVLGNLVLLQDVPNKPGTWFAPFMNNAPLWSLSYEWFFYMALFPALRLTRRNWFLGKFCVPLVAAAAIVVYDAFPNQICLFIAYFPLWWAGGELAREYLEAGHVTWRGQLTSICSLCVLTGVWYALALGHARSPGSSGAFEHPWLEMRHFATTVLILTFGMIWYKTGGRGFTPLLGWAERFAPISYGLYVIHLPVLHLALAPALRAPLWLTLSWVIPVTLALAYAAERLFQPVVDRAIAIPRRAGAV